MAEPARAGNHAAALLLRAALRLKLRAGAGPFRSFGNIAVEPRAYQLVPLLMALRLSTVRLLIADDVGVGKTIDAGVIVRELMDRGEVRCLAVLCPPHLVEQWQAELENRFNLHSVALTSASAARLERQGLARHFVQRRRKDISDCQAETKDGHGFPRRMQTEITYRLSGPWGSFFDQVQDYCTEIAERVEGQDTGGARLIGYANLALLRCVASSPAAAAKALTTRLEHTLTVVDPPNDDLLRDERLFDGEADDLDTSDLAPLGQIAFQSDQASRLQGLIDQAHQLAGRKGDPKLAILLRHLTQLLDDGYHPVVFCRYLATAHDVGEHLRNQPSNVEVEVVTGELTPEERCERIEAMAEAEQRILVVTDCLSEGINRQHRFTAVVHYDLAWNPTRHEQREGRVDRFGQRAPEVRCNMLYGQDNPVDGFILNVILRKGEAIQKELGVLVPMPEDAQRIHQALVKAALIRRSELRQQPAQLGFDFRESEEILAPLEA